VRTVGYSIGSALSATVLVSYIPHGRSFPFGSGYRTAALVSIGVLAAAFAVSLVFAAGRRRNSH
jgi:hypothetical protein